MHYEFIRPGSGLEPYIEHYWIMETTDAEAGLSERVIPTGSAQLMIHYGRPFEVLRPDKLTFTQPRLFLSGISTTYVDVTAPAASGVIVIVFRPAGACRFFRFPLSECGGGLVDLSATAPADSRQLLDGIDEAPDKRTRIALMECWLRRTLQEHGNKDARLTEAALCQMQTSVVSSRMSDLSISLGVSNRQLERRFASHLGISPKQFARIIRFRRALKAFYSRSETSMAGLACACGYFDQAHFIHDFRELSGYSPAEFFCTIQCDPDFL